MPAPRKPKPRRPGHRRPGEFELIERYFAPLARGFPGAAGLRNDNATIRPPKGHELLVKTDAIVAGVHFLPGDPPGQIAAKALRVNLSDIAAGGGKPLAYQMALALPADWTERWMAQFCRGLAADQRRYGVYLCGGDTVAMPGPLTVSITLFGSVPFGTGLGRGGAKAGDDIWVSGTLGDATLGLLALAGKLPDLPARHRRALIDRYRLPRPRLALSRLLRRFARATIDISDGLVADLGHICDVSGVGADVSFETLPLSPAARLALAARPSLGALLVSGGDDYEILFTASPRRRREIRAMAVKAGVPLARIGGIAKGGGVRIVRDGRAMQLARKGFAHF